MRLYLVQHGEATTEDVNPERPLTEKGRGDSSRTADLLRSAGVSVDVIWHSTRARAVETARIFGERLSPKDGLEQKTTLGPNDPVSGVLSDVISADKDIMVVGHLPFLQKITSLALVGSESDEIVRFRMGGVVALERDEKGKWLLAFEVIPDLLK